MSNNGQSGTGLTDKKHRLVAVIAGNFTTDNVNKAEVAIAPLTTQHQQLIDTFLADPSASISFLSAAAKADAAASAAAAKADAAKATAAAAALKKRQSDEAAAEAAEANKKQKQK